MKNATTLADAEHLKVSEIFDIEEAYEAYVQSIPRETVMRQGYFHPSAIGACGRRNVYEYIKAPVGEGHGFSDQEIFDLGHAIHDLVQTKLTNAAEVMGHRGYEYKFEAEVGFDKATDELYLNYGVGGTTDGILEVTYPCGARQRGIFECKSINKAGYAALKAPKEEHVLQATLYAYRFNCPIIWIWYYSKDTSASRVFTLTFDPDMLNKALLRYAEWLGHVEAGTLPNRDESWYICPRCEYREICEPVTLRKKTTSTPKLRKRGK